MHKVIEVSDVPDKADSDELKRKVEKKYGVKIVSVERDGSSATLRTLVWRSITEEKKSYGYETSEGRPDFSYEDISFSEL